MHRNFLDIPSINVILEYCEGDTSFRRLIFFMWYYVYCGSLSILQAHNKVASSYWFIVEVATRVSVKFIKQLNSNVMKVCKKKDWKEITYYKNSYMFHQGRCHMIWVRYGPKHFMEFLSFTVTTYRVYIFYNDYKARHYCTTKKIFT